MLTAAPSGPVSDEPQAPTGTWRGLGARLEPTGLAALLARLRRHPHPIITALVAVYAGVLVPYWRAAGNLLGRPTVVLVLMVASLLAMCLTPRRMWWLRMAVPLAAAAFVYVEGEGEVLTLWVPLALVSVAWAVADRPPLPLRGRVVPGADVLVGILSWVAWNQFTLEDSVKPLAVLALGPALMLVASGRSPAPARWLDRAATAGEHFVLHAIEWVASAVIAIVALLVRLIGRAFFRDHPDGWAKVEEQLPDPRRARRRDKRAFRRGWGPFATAVVLVAAAALLIRLLTPLIEAERGKVSFPSDKGVSAKALGVAMPKDPIPAAYTGDDWYPGFREDMAWVTDERVAWRPLTVQRVLDVETPTVNVHDRVRDSWKAPPCDCKRVKLWLYGGSGAFGLGQRDDHTIASELARLAAKDGIALDVQNRGIPGEMHWRNSTRFAWDLAVDPKPDMVAFYEGAEEVESELELRSRGLADTRAPLEPFATNLYEEVVGAPKGAPETPDGVTYEGWPELDKDPGKPGQLAVKRYDRSLEMSNRSAQAAEVPVRYFWQPTRFSGSDGPELAKDDLRGRAFRNAPRYLPKDVVDLSAALDGTKAPLFSDDTNHNEVAAKLIAAAMWKELRPQVRGLAQS